MITNGQEIILHNEATEITILLCRSVVLTGSKLKQQVWLECDVLFLQLSEFECQYFWELTKICISGNTPLAIPRTWLMPLCMLPINGGNKKWQVVGYKLLSTHTIPTPNSRQQTTPATNYKCCVHTVWVCTKTHMVNKKQQCWRHWSNWGNKNDYSIYSL